MNILKFGKNLLINLLKIINTIKPNVKIIINKARAVREYKNKRGKY